MIKVFYESMNHAELVAIIDGEELYNKLLPILEQDASDKGMYVTESVDESVLIDELIVGDCGIKDSEVKTIAEWCKIKGLKWIAITSDLIGYEEKGFDVFVKEYPEYFEKPLVAEDDGNSILVVLP
jgi:hypothetical protein